jgi:L-ascorbate metabolism protein UlaG (beta-lactamase superfamily)
MFDIEYKGGNTVVIATKKSKLITDPKQSLIGLKDIEPKNMVALATEPRFEVVSEEATIAIEGPGEYEVADFSIRGIPAQRHIDTEGHGSTMYRVEIGEVRLAILGNIDSKLSEDQLEAIGIVDILVLPVGGGGYTLDATSAAHLARQIDAKVIIPVHYADNGLKYEVPQDEFEVFHKELGGEVENVDKLKVKAASALPPVLTIYKLTRS